MDIRVLGAGAGGGFPQWNCNCHNCHRLRTGTFPGRARTQSSIAVSSGGPDWILFNCSPDIRTQIQELPALQPGRALRDTGIAGIVLVDAQIDHTTGLLSLREGDPVRLYCTELVYEDLTTGYPVINLLGYYGGVNWQEVAIDGKGFSVPGVADLTITAVPLASDAPPYSPRRGQAQPGDNIGLRVEDSRTGGRLFYAPGLGETGPKVEEEMARADCVMVDGTFWRDDELEQAGVGAKRATEIGHLPQSGAGGMLEVLERTGARRQVLIHINNTNPILDETSPEREELDAAGVEVAYDGMTIES